MQILFYALLILHFIGWAIVLGGWIATMREPGVYRGTLHGALTALVSGLGMAAIGFSGAAGHDYDHVKIAVKTAITLVIVGLALWAKKRPDTAPPWLKHAIGGGAVVNVIIAVVWR